MDRTPEENMLQPAETDLTGVGETIPWVVGIGAGAGGLEAIQLVFGAMPADIGAAFIICRHLQSGLSDPLADLLCTQTSMPVVRAENGMLLEPGRIHLVAPDAKMILLKDRLVAFRPDAPDAAELSVSPIDVLLHSLAASAGSKAIALMLSGQDHDGLAGCASIRSHGGLVLAQHPDSTEFAGMPGRVIDADLPSAVATPGALADLIRRHVSRRPAPVAEPDGRIEDEEALARIATLLAGRLKIDMHAYRPSHIAKRVRRRLSIAKTSSLKDYADRLAFDDGELKALHDDLLIRVTAFFRDPEAFSALEQDVLPALVQRMSKERPIRIWVPACASGEEAYSLAMQFLDRCERAGKVAHVEVIASDRHLSAIAAGRLGLYAKSSLGPTRKSLIARFMHAKGDGLEIGAELRRYVTFVEHDILKTEPPDNIDLVSCRNLLIYLSPKAQKQALVACHRALRPGGFLFLGVSEQPGSKIKDLETVSGKWRIYKKADEPEAAQSLAKLAKAYRQKPAEPLPPPKESMAANPMAASRQLLPSEGDQDGFNFDDLMDHQRMLESTIDTLLSTNETLRRRNQDLRAENQRLAQAHAALDDVATMIAHDLKSPLSAVGRMAERLSTVLTTHDAGKEATRWLKPMWHRLEALNQIIDDLLAFARESPADPADLKQVDFADLLRESLALVGLPKGIRVVIQPPSLRITTWRIPLACIFRNLLAQAIERIGDASGTIRIDATPTEGSLEVAIIDNGRLASDRLSDLGLAIVRQLLETTGGKLSAGANPSHAGHHISFTWPIEDSAILETGKEASSPA